MGEEGRLSELPFPEEISQQPSRVGVVAVLVLASFGALWGLSGGPVLGDHEAIVAQCAREIRQTGHWLIPTFNDVPFIRKPPLQPWLVAIASRLIDPKHLNPPVSVMASRLPSAIAAILAVWVVCRMGQSMYGRRTGLVGALIMGCCIATLFFSHNAQTEMLTTMFMACAMAAFWFGIRRPSRRTRYMIAFYVMLSLAMLAKAPLPLALVGASLFVYWFGTVPLAKGLIQRSRIEGRDGSPLVQLGRALVRQFRRLPRLWLIPGIILFLVLASLWPLYVYFKVENAIALWRTEFVDRYAGMLDEKPEPWWYYLPLAFGVMVPFCLSLPEALAAPFLKAYRKERAGLLFAFTWVAAQVLFLSTSAFKRPHYLLPVVPGLCLLLAPVIDRLFLAPRTFDVRRVRAAVIGIVGALVIGLPIGLYMFSKDEPGLTRVTWPGAVLLIIGIISTGWLFVSRRRLASLGALSLTTLTVFAWSWSMLGRADYKREAVKLADELKRLNVGPEDRITWAIGRADARVVYHSGMKIRPVFTELEMAARRRGRLEVPGEVLVEGAHRLKQMLNSRRKEYIIVEADKLEQWGMIKGMQDLTYREVCRVEVNPRDPDDALIVITNAWNTGVTSAPANKPSTTTASHSAIQ